MNKPEVGAAAMSMCENLTTLVPPTAALCPRPRPRPRPRVRRRVVDALIESVRTASLLDDAKADSSYVGVVVDRAKKTTLDSDAKGAEGGVGQVVEFGVIVLTCCRADKHVDVLRQNVLNLATFYPDAPIVILDDWSSLCLQKVLGPLPDHVKIERTEHRGSGEVAPLYYYWKHPFARRVLYVQDSLHVLKPIDNLPGDAELAFLGVHCIPDTYHLRRNTVLPTRYNISHRIGCADDLLRDLVRKCLRREFVRYFNSVYLDSYKWRGWWGLMGLMSHEFIKQLEARTGVLSCLAPQITNRERREAAEFIFGIAAQYAHGPNSTIPVLDTAHLGPSPSGRFHKFSFQR